MATYEKIIQFSRQLRKNQTAAEERVWKIVRGKKICGAKFLRQHPIIYEATNNDYQFFIADFHCDEHRLVIEIDGNYHDFQKHEDYQRDLILEEMGLKTVRFKNHETYNSEYIKSEIRNLISSDQNQDN